ncbi:MAG: hypothetical protein AAGA55_01575 [Planctomycetota bacterium]
MRKDTTLIGSIVALALAAGAGSSLADDAQPASEETVTVVVNMPDGRRVEIEEPAQPSRTEGVSSGTSVRKVLPDGSVMSYGNGDGKRVRKSRRSGRSSGSSSSGGAGVSTIGDPTYSQDAATGGQDVRFLDSGISAMLVGRTLYVWGARLVQSDEPFDLIEGSRFAFDGVIARDAASIEAEEDPLFAPIKIEYEANTVVNLVLHARSESSEAPERAIRTWTFRVR